ncbi:epoxide hydrolase family protein [Leifsonia sp. NPDC058292]|uniref:epoxide hydrolase family protein n=1 Tax=Leifsonia sp. NPDC058292 TaxID=3346428 RepID=UPI0036DF29F8
MEAQPAPFRIAIPDAEIDDLKQRLARTRYPVQTPAEPWDAGVDIPYLRTLMTQWHDTFDWRAAEERLNRYPQFTAMVKGERVHFVRLEAQRRQGSGERGSGEPEAIILSHGWPYSFIELLPLAERLADPAAFGGSSDDALDVVIPSLPGYGFSEPMADPFTSPAVAERWHTLMTQVLGYAKYATYGEDVGTWVSDRLAATHPESVVALFATHAAFPPAERGADLTAEEEEFVAWLDRKWKRASAYSSQQSTRPDTLAVGLTDSPAGLAAWLVEKFREWSGGSRISDYWSTDDLLTTISLYWFTGTIGTSFRAYYDDKDEPSMPRIGVPVGVSIQWGERGFPRHYAERTYDDIRFWNDLPTGGHFTAKQTPDLVAADMHAFFGTLRGGGGSAGGGGGPGGGVSAG